MHSVIVPTYNEERNPMFPLLLASLRNVDNLEVLFVDGASTDDTVAMIEESGLALLKGPPSNRAARYNAGIKQTNGYMVLLHHPRTLLDDAGLRYFSELSNENIWGGFRHQFDDAHPFLRFTSWYSNFVRPKRGIVYLDHCIFAPRRWLTEIGGMPEVDIFEDTDLSIALRRFSPPKLLPFPATTSSIRFKRNGYVRQAVRNQVAKWAYYLKRDKSKINLSYEKQTNLNFTKQK